MLRAGKWNNLHQDVPGFSKLSWKLSDLSQSEGRRQEEGRLDIKAPGRMWPEQEILRQVDSIAVSLFWWSEQILNRASDGKIKITIPLLREDAFSNTRFLTNCCGQLWCRFATSQAGEWTEEANSLKCGGDTSSDSRARLRCRTMNNSLKALRFLQCNV